MKVNASSFTSVTLLSSPAPTVCLCPPDIDMPRINYNFNSRKHRFVYGICAEESTSVVKVTVVAVALHKCYFPRGS